jgi:hypothetical protein
MPQTRKEVVDRSRAPSAWCGNTSVPCVADHEREGTTMPKYLVKASYTPQGLSGAAATSVTVLLSPEEVDSAAKIPVAYRAPGH